MNMGLTYWIFISNFLGRIGGAKRKRRNWRRNDGEEKGSLGGRREKRVGGDERRS